MPNQKSIIVAGAGTAGLTSALIIKNTFPHYDVKIVYSDKIGIVGVGEGSTEHWRWFQEYCGIHPDEMVKYCDITHKYGIKFEGWTTHTPSYIHSVATTGVSALSFLASYNLMLENNKLLTNTLSWRGLLQDNILDQQDEDGIDRSHFGTNQYHFDTFKLNSFLKQRCDIAGIGLIEGEIQKVNLDSHGYISNIKISSINSLLSADLYVDASGFSRVLSSKMNNIEFNSFRKYLPCDSAIVFQTDSDPSGKIHPYTRAIAMNAGWMWEIPTQSRRGNGYVFSSDYISEEEALREAEEFHGIKIDNHRLINYRSGYYSAAWQKNCVAIGLSNNFIEPLEATTISIGIQQAKLLCSYLPTWTNSSKYIETEYNRIHKSIMENAVSMIALHYMSDREDTPMWRDQKKAEKPQLLKRLLNIWSERLPESHDIDFSGFELFAIPHLWHVAQGQGVLNPDLASVALDAYGSRLPVVENLNNLMSGYLSAKVIDHAEALARTKNS